MAYEKIFLPRVPSLDEIAELITIMANAEARGKIKHRNKQNMHKYHMHTAQKIKNVRMTQICKNRTKHK